MRFRFWRRRTPPRPARHAVGPPTDPAWSNARTAAYPVVRPGTAGNLTPAQTWRASHSQAARAVRGWP
ncbi:hypothetical protein ABT336_27105, partial [Micromonospora sp. NPDC000207]